MIKAFSQRLIPPYSGQVQIAESDRARAITMDGASWEIHFLRASKEGSQTHGPAPKGTFVRAASIRQTDLDAISSRAAPDYETVDERIVQLAAFLAEASLPFPAADTYEYWLLDADDESPLALIFSCTEAEHMPLFPVRPEWTALPAAVMPIEATQEETDRCDAPVNYRVERLIASKAGSRPRARWFNRRRSESESFPVYMLKEDWLEEEDQQLCRRYIERQSTRLLMLHGLEAEERRRMELAAKPYALEVERFYPLYPEIVDAKVVNAIRAEARLRGASGEQLSPLLRRRDGVLYL
jgi:hypothetical protein